MALSFVYGPAGAGKSTYVQNLLIKESAEHSKENFFLIVPDQFTMQTQADIVNRHPDGGILNVDVLSFSRLAYRIFEETGKPRETILDDTGKSLVLRHVATKVAKDMPYIGKNLDKTGYIHEVKSSISEFMQYSISPKDLEHMSGKTGSDLLKGKLNDLAVIYSAFMEYNRGRYITGEEQLDILCSKLDLSDAIKGSTVVFDGFTGFTPVQERVILKLLELCKDVYITLTISAPEELSEVGSEEKLFYLSRTTANRLISKAKEQKTERGEDILVEPGESSRFGHSAELTHLEKNLFRYPLVPYTEKCQNIASFAGENVRTEVDEVCLRILKLIREEGYAYRDIAIVSGSLEAYGDLFERRFNELGIPCFVDRTRGIVLNPFTEYLKSALNIIINNYSYDSVFHFLRTGFTDFEIGEIDRFDNYVRSLNIRGKSAYHKPFLKAQRDRMNNKADKERALLEIEVFEAFRVKLVEILAPLEKKCDTASDFVINLYEFIKNSNSYEKLQNMADEFDEAGDTLRYSEYSRVYKLIMELLDTVYGLLGDTPMALDEFYKVFDAGISEISVGSIPANVDRIVVGDIERTRLKEVKALFFTGINDGYIPKSSSRAGILSDMDRDFFKAQSVDLAPTPREEAYRQKLYLYMNMCKPSEKLVLSYSGADRDGKGLKPAYLIGTIGKLFPTLEVENIYDVPDAKRITSVNDCLRQYGVIARKAAINTATETEKELAATYARVLEATDAGRLFDMINDAAFYEYSATPLSRDIVKLIYGTVINSSITRMEKFAGCAYAHFLKYGMLLKDAATDEFNAADLGTIYHGVLDKFAQKLADNHLSWGDFSSEDGEAFLDEVVEEYVLEYGQGMLTDDARRNYTIKKISRVMKRTIDTLQFQVKRGNFVPSEHEIRFSRGYELADGTRLSLNGAVDRVDLYEKDGEIFVKIMDFKSSKKDINITNVYFGLEQQLEVYMSEIIAMEQKKHPGKKVHPAALLYYTLDNPVIEVTPGTAEEKIKKEIRKKLAMTGIVDADESVLVALDNMYRDESLVAPIKEIKADKDLPKSMLTIDEINNLLNYTDRMVLRIGNRIMEGDISCSPFINDKKDSCKYCSYSGVCRFEDNIDGYASRDEGKLTDEAAKENVCGGDSNGDYLFS